ncbi:hypothetical protein CRE_21240 [Caenorhabditis remanei]|uniref:Uncharacterized protein n=1 Tax=Caenorhabditis remanei TaxID=31234 RepID=E3MF19_CAERE|nr:hypothetical protein CRE_21240 [Caenorhabditis remanei]
MLVEDCSLFGLVYNLAGIVLCLIAMTLTRILTKTPHKFNQACVFCEGSQKSDRCFNVPEYKDRKKKLMKDRLCIKCLLPHKEDIPCTSKKKCMGCWKKTHHCSMRPEGIEIKWEESDGQSDILSVHQKKTC